MAIVIPSLEKILKQNTLKKGEKLLLEFLIDNLDESYEVYFKPYLNCDSPDVLVMRYNSGVMLFEVSDLELKDYVLNSKGELVSRKNNKAIRSPFWKLKEYKDNMYALHFEKLMKMKVDNYKNFSLIKTAVFFPYDTNESVKRFFNADFCEMEKYNCILAGKSLNKSIFEEELNRFYMNRNSKFFKEDLYYEIKKYVNPGMHRYEEGKNLHYSSKQRELMVSKAGSQKIKGVAGSGKTLILAQRAVNAHLRTGGEILILTYNISLRNYIKNKLRNIKADFNWSSIRIENYHQFIKSQLNNNDIPINIPNYLKGLERRDYVEKNYFSNVEIFHGIEIRNKYKAVFIDEVQDYKKDWLDIIKGYFLEEDGEYVIFGDEKQNVYLRTLDTDKKPRTNISGAWRLLNQSYRLSGNIWELAQRFQNRYFKERYEIDYIEGVNLNMIEEPQTIDYVFMNEMDLDFFTEKVFNFAKFKGMSMKDSCIVAFKIDSLRNIDYHLRNRLKFGTTTIFETKEEFDALKVSSRSRLIEEIRRNKKYNFNIDDDNIKISTIHSFKGWEVDNLFLIIDGEDHVSDELIYTAFTRCLKNLFILNVNNIKYHDFFMDIKERQQI